MSDNRSKIKNGDLYLASDPQLTRERLNAHSICHQYNATPGCNPAKLDILYQILGAHGNDCYIEPAFFCDYGYNIMLGDNVYLNTSCCILDCATVQIGSHAKLGPNVQIYTAAHPLEPDVRQSGLEFAKPVVIGDNVWIGGNSIVLPGVAIGSNSVIGAGSVVTRNIPESVVAAGNPCKIIRRLGS